MELENLIRATFPEDPDTAVAIAQCESSLNPEAVNHHNPNGSYDSGLMQINSVHTPRLSELGLDPKNAQDNLTYARILYDERGWQPWVCYTAGLIYAK